MEIKIEPSEFTVLQIDASEVTIADYYMWNHIKVVKRGDNSWGISDGQQCLGRDGYWSYESSPSNRTDAWLKYHRFSFEEACDIAVKYAPKYEVNGLTAKQCIEKYKVQDARSAERRDQNRKISDAYYSGWRT